MLRLWRNEDNCWGSANFKGNAFANVFLSLVLGDIIWDASGLWWLGLLGAVGTALLLCLVIGLLWIRPEWFTGDSAFKLCFAGGVVGGAWSMAQGLARAPAPQGTSLQAWIEHLTVAAKLMPLTPYLVSALLLLGLLLTASQRREQMARDLAYAQSLAAQEAARSEATEARLRLLQAQIQPHFIFNTLAAVQHWVDVGDPRASGLLRRLTAFLRGSAELLNQPQASLAQELPLTEHYLEVMQARWSQRLRYRMEIDQAVARRAILPPGVVLTLVENALEHGVAPRLEGAEVLLRLQGLPMGGWRLEVQDSGQGLSEGWSEGLGLRNCRARMEHLFPGRAHLQLHKRQGENGTLAVLTFDAPSTQL